MRPLRTLITGAAIWALAALAAIVPGSTLAEDVLQGTYIGVDDARGARIDIRPDPDGFTGTFYDPQGKSQDFKADKVGDAAEGVLDMDGQVVLLRIAPLPYGAQVSLIPFSAEGNLVLEFARSLAFIRQGMKLPETREGIMPAPRSDCTRIAGYSFLVSYEFWEPAGVVNGYLCLPDRTRVLMNMFPAVQLDVIWKLCLAPQADDALAIALRGQDVTCAEVRDTIANAQRRGRFDDYKAEVSAELDTLTMAVRCGDGYPESREACEAAAKRLKEAAISLRTASSVLNRYR